MRTRIIGLVLLTLFAAATPAQNNEQNRPPIIDVHVHAYEKDERWAIKVPNPRTGQPMTATSEPAHMQATLDEMKKYNIVKAFVSNQYAAVLRWQAAAPEVILPSYAIDDPATVDLTFLRKEHAAGRLKALGELGLQYFGLVTGAVAGAISARALRSSLAAATSNTPSR